MSFDIITQIGLQFGALGILGYTMHIVLTKINKTLDKVEKALNNLAIAVSHCPINTTKKKK
jgi:uncharacterized protein YoxC